MPINTLLDSSLNILEGCYLKTLYSEKGLNNKKDLIHKNVNAKLVICSSHNDINGGYLRALAGGNTSSDVHIVCSCPK